MLLQIQYVISKYKDKENQCQPQIFHVNANWDFPRNCGQLSEMF